ncbi:MAG: single-stranded-DNA-specific exonuclease RecJ [Clostridia bacterium]|nr:single-stranded-DNA-specific exonuclease RecJ [Clostridia bacterium]
MEPERKNKIWQMPADLTPDEQAQVAALVADTGLLPLTARLLYTRGLRSAEAITRFLHCEDTLLHSPFLLPDIDRAVARVRAAVEGGEKIAIYGDYDVDGVTAVSLLYLFLKEKGADVGYYIPSRTGEGYGLSHAALDSLAARGVSCIITVDTGITAVEETEYAREKGMDLVITDHHECRPVLPNAAAVVNPHRPDSRYPFAELAGVGVVFKLVTAYECTLGMERGEREAEGVRRVTRAYADLVALGTIADVMPIVDENRLIVTLGLAQMERGGRAGLTALIAEASAGNGGTTQKRKINSQFVGFGLAPRLNAAGRMRDASLAAELLLAETEAEARPLAAALCAINRERQQEENQIVEQALHRIEQEFDLADTRVLVLEDDHWRQGIIGIVSSRITERYGLPSILISFDQANEGFSAPDDIGKGSGRSVKGLNLVEALTACEELLVKFGGHELAAGLSIRRADLAEFRTRINAYAKDRLPEGGAKVTLMTDGALSLSDVELAFVAELSRLEPFGSGNPVPQFVLFDLTVTRITELGGGKHLKLTVTQGEKSLFALLFSTSLARFGLREGDRVDLLCTLSVNEYRGVQSVQLVVQDYRVSAHYADECDRMAERYRTVRSGAPFLACECFVPTREDCAHVYTVLRREFRMGNDAFPERTLLSLVNADGTHNINYVCLKYILDIFRELNICGVEEDGAGHYRFDIYFNPSKTSIEHSSILKRLKSQCSDD